MKNVLKDIQNGTFAKGFIADNQAGFRNSKKCEEQNGNHPIEKLGQN